MNINRRGLFGTLFLHGLVLVLLILGGLTFPDPPPEEEGIMVNFGTDDTGFGFVEPKGDDTNAGNPELEIAQNVPEVVEETLPDPAPADPVYEEPAYEEPLPADNTQDVEETPIKEDPKPSAEEIRKQQEEIDRINREKEAERIKKIEEDRIRKEEEAERIKKAEEERIRKEEERARQEKADKISNMGQGAFGQQGVGEEDGSEGVNPGSGTNQGVTTGSPGAPNYGDGQGLGDKDWGLDGRNVLNKITPNLDNCSVTSRIVITVEIKVDQLGIVKSASVTKSTFTDNCINEAVLAAARRTKFNNDPNAAFQQTGWIKYTIEP